MAHNENKRLQLKAEVFKAMGHPLRLGVIELLQDGEKCVCEIVEQVGTEISNVSKHLSVLKKAGIVADRRDGLKIMYRLTMPCALDFAKCVENVVIKRLDEQRSAMVAWFLRNPLNFMICRLTIRTKWTYLFLNMFEVFGKAYNAPQRATAINHESGYLQGDGTADSTKDIGASSG
jgi:DNA-binding transcriptional ArsR family regulator